LIWRNSRPEAEDYICIQRQGIKIPYYFAKTPEAPFDKKTIRRSNSTASVMLPRNVIVQDVNGRSELKSAIQAH
jgi:hypothetical protein